MIITISDMWKNQQKMLDNDNQIKLSSLIVFLARSQGTHSRATPRRARCYPVSARYSRVAVLCLPMRVEAHTPW